MPQHRYRPAVRVRPADLAVQSRFCDAVRGGRSAGWTGRPDDHPRGAASPHRAREDLRPDGRRRLLLPAEPAGPPLPGAAMSALTSQEVLRPGPQGFKHWMAARVTAVIPFGLRVL